MTRVIHTGDTHIGYRQYHSSERRHDFLRAFEQVITDAIEMDVDAVVHAGDLFHDSRPDLTDLLATLEYLRELATANIPFLAIVGNHERTRDRQWIDLFAELDLATRLSEEGITIGNTTFYGLDYVPASHRERLEFAFDEPSTDHVALVAHGLFEPFAHAEWDTAALLDRLPIDVDCLLLGDNHTPGQETVGETLVTYCGSTERASASEETERGYNLVTFAEGVHVTRRTLDVTRSFEYLDIDLAPDEGLSRIRDRINEHDLEDTVVIIRMEGEGTEITPAAVEEHALEAGALVARIVDRRDLTSESDHHVHFADPSEAIDARVRELGLSPAGDTVESLIRDPGVADSNVRDRATERVRELLETDRTAFQSGEPGSASGGPSVGDSPDRPNESSSPTGEAEEPMTDEQQSILEFK